MEMDVRRGIYTVSGKCFAASRHRLHHRWQRGFHYQSVCGFDSHYAISFLERKTALDCNHRVALAVIGAFLLSTSGRFVFQFGDALELVRALFWTFHVIVLGKFASRYDAMSFSVGQLTICGLLNLVIGIFVEPIHSLANISLIGSIIYTAIFSLGIAYTLQIWAQRHTPPTDAALILGLESVFSVISGWVILHENLVPMQIFGCCLILFAVLLSQFKEWKPSSKIELVAEWNDDES